MELLEFLEGIHYVLVLGKLLRHLAEFLLSLKILLEVEIAQIPVNLNFIVELLYIELISVIYVSEILDWNRSNGTPSCLKFTECRESCTQILLILDEGLQIVNHSLFPCEILLPLGLLPAVVLRTLLLVSGIYGFEAIFKDCERIQIV